VKLASGRPRAAEGGQDEGDECSDDADDHQQIDEREGGGRERMSAPGRGVVAGGRPRRAAQPSADTSRGFIPKLGVAGNSFRKNCGQWSRRGPAESKWIAKWIGGQRSKFD
jgi:hypothetical protein